MVTEHELLRAIDDLYPRPKKGIDAQASKRTDLKGLVQTDPQKVRSELTMVIDALKDEWVSLPVACVYLNCTRQTLSGNRTKWGGAGKSDWKQIKSNQRNGKMLYRLAWLKEVSHEITAIKLNQQAWKKAREEGPIEFTNLKDFQRAIKVLMDDDEVIHIALPKLSPTQRAKLKKAGLFMAQMPMFEALTEHAWVDQVEQQVWMKKMRLAMDKARTELETQTALSERLMLLRSTPEPGQSGLREVHL